MLTGDRSENSTVKIPMRRNSELLALPSMTVVRAPAPANVKSLVMGIVPSARRLGVEVTTVRTHLHSLYGKLRVKSRVELVLYASRAGYTTP